MVLLNSSDLLQNAEYFLGAVLPIKMLQNPLKWLNITNNRKRLRPHWRTYT